ncbi:MAG: glycogen debranching protein GlgX [Gammaproteobacteria bacterium]
MASDAAVGPVTAVWPGRPYPLGATWDGHGVNFALYSAHADAVQLCLFNAKGRREVQRIPLTERSHDVWHAYLPEARPGTVYGYRVSGPYQPERGHRFNPNKLLIDPYARELTGALRWSDALYGYTIGHRREDLSFDRRESASGMPKCRVIDGAFDWGDEPRVRVPWEDTVIYEMHVGGYTRLHPLVPPALRGSFAGLTTPAVIEHLRRLGVTTLEFLPVHAFIDDRHLVEKGLRNYWGYNTLAFFAPEPRYCATGAAQEFKTLVCTLHHAGFEVLLDVVYNHTAEGNERGPTLSLRGIDNASYYRLEPEQPRYYRDYSGCGNTLNTPHPRVLQLVMDSLRYWVEEMHVDGFRFDLAAAVGREYDHVDWWGSFFDAVSQDPVLSRVKLIAEPWDLGLGGYQTGQFPAGWSEWNDRYRDTARAWWKGDAGRIGDFALRLTGSRDLFGHHDRLPSASINFVTAHDGFTLRDLVSYNDKHNEANGEDNRDGHSDNLAWNCGVEGASDDPEVRALRARQQRNFIATLLLSQGVPMLLAGDECGRSQQGNNNAYCQDNELSWQNWEVDSEGATLLEFTRRLIALRRAHATLRRRAPFRAEAMPGCLHREIWWMTPTGEEMDSAHWEDVNARCLGVYLCGAALGERDARGVPRDDASFLLLVNAHHEAVPFRLPGGAARRWLPLVDTVFDDGRPALLALTGDEQYPLEGRALVLLRDAGGGA